MTKFDPEKIARKLYLSERKRQVWGWVGEKAVGSTFYTRDVGLELHAGFSSVRYHVLSLEALELIARQTPAFETASIPRWPYTRLDHPLWPEVIDLVRVANENPRPPRPFSGT